MDFVPTGDPVNETRYHVVVNHEGQYSLWPAGRELPLGWTSLGEAGTKEDCLRRVEAAWTDMRPLSLRTAQESPSDAVVAVTDRASTALESPVVRLATGTHPVRAVLANGGDLDAFRRAVEAGYVHVEFTDTQGGTRLGLRLDRDACDLANCHAATAKGTVRLVGRLTLDFVTVRCAAEIDLATFAGSGRLDVEP